MGARNLVTHLDELLDVDVETSAPTDGQALVWGASEGLWVPGSVSGGGASSGAEMVRAVAGWTTQTVPSGSSTNKLTIATPSVDTGPFFDPGAPTVLTAPTDGLYLIGAQAGASDNTALTWLRVLKNGSVLPASTSAFPDQPTGFHMALSTTVLAPLEAGDEVSFNLRHDHGSSRNLYTSGTGCWIVRLTDDGDGTIDGGTFADAGSGTVDGGSL